MADTSNEVEVEAPGAFSWVVRGLYVAAIAANLWLVWDWYSETPAGQAFVTRCQGRIERARTWAAECEGCAQRKAKLQGLINHVHFEATEIVEQAAADSEQPPS